MARGLAPPARLLPGSPVSRLRTRTQPPATPPSQRHRRLESRSSRSPTERRIPLCPLRTDQPQNEARGSPQRRKPAQQRPLKPRNALCPPPSRGGRGAPLVATQRANPTRPQVFAKKIPPRVTTREIAVSSELRSAVKDRCLRQREAVIQLSVPVELEHNAVALPSVRNRDE